MIQTQKDQDKEIPEIMKGRWQWKSNQDPWSTLEEPQWTSYPLASNYLIEKAYYDKEKEIDLNNGYIISIQHMLQRQKGRDSIQRPIRRIEWMEDIEEIGRSERYFETELPKIKNKTINNVFGSLTDFVNFFSKRSPEILAFTEQFNQIEKSNDPNSLKDQIIPNLVEVFKEEMLKPTFEQLSNSSLSKVQKKMLSKRKEECEEFVDRFRQGFSSFENFYGEILKAYTMSTRLYENLNQHLRNENWVEINKLLPYALCLCKAFFHLKNNQKSHQESGSMILYRGCTFDNKSISSYNIEKVKSFSWNAITSTTKKREIAEEFMYGNQDIQKEKYPVMFIIEMPSTQETQNSEYLQWVDIHKYSVKPREDEIIFPPGSVFELEDASTDADKRTTIRIKFKEEVKSLARKGTIMPGAMQSEMITEKEVKIMCLEGKDLMEALESIHGNQLVEEIEFCLCTFDSTSLRGLLEILPTVGRATGLKFISCSYKDEKRQISSPWIAQMLSDNLQILKIKIFEMNDFSKVFCFNNEHNSYWMSLRSLDIDFRSLAKISEEIMHDFGSRGLKHLSQLTSLNLDFSRKNYFSSFEDQGGNHMCSLRLKYLTQMKSLKINFSGCKEITDEGISCLTCYGFKDLIHLEFLDLNFSGCIKLTDEAINYLTSQGFKHFVKLKSLNLNFSNCVEITDKGMKNLTSRGLKYSTNLTSLDLNFSKCEHVTDEGVHSLWSKGIRYLVKLTFLGLNFDSCKWLTMGELNDLFSQGLKNLIDLSKLNINVSYFNQGKDRFMRTLKLEGLSPLMKLNSFTFTYFKALVLSDGGVENVLSEVFKYLRKVTYLSLNRALYRLPLDGSDAQDFDPRRKYELSPSYRLVCNRRLDVLNPLEEIQNLADDQVTVFNINSIEEKIEIGRSGNQDPALFNLELSNQKDPDKRIIDDPYSLKIKEFFQLKSLSTNLFECCDMTDERIHTLCSHVLKNQTNLTSLNMSFAKSGKTTNQGLQNFATEGLKFLPHLTSLSLNLSDCGEITDEGVSHLFFQGSKFLKNLRSLNLNLSSCSAKIETAKSVNCCRGLRNFSQLTSLSLNLEHYSALTDERIDYFCSEELKYLTQLLSLNLNCAESWLMTDVGMNHFSQALSNLTQLKSLTLNFYKCEEIRDEGVANLCSQGLQKLSQLTSLSLNFDSCMNLTNEVINNLSFQGLKYLPHLLSLNLNLSGIYAISNEEINNLCSQGLQNCLKLTSLHLDLSNCRITDEGMSYFSSQGLKYLANLTILRLSFSGCSKITDEGVSHLCSQGFKSLVNLTSLDLNFSDCSEIRDGGVNSFCSQGLKYMTQLISLTLDFSKSHQITYFTMLNIVRILRYFGFLVAEDERQL